VALHSQSPPPTTAEQAAPDCAHVPTHVWLLLSKRQVCPGIVVVVAPAIVVLVVWKMTGPRDAGEQRSVVILKRITRCHPTSSLICVSAGNGFGHFAV